MTRNSWLGTSNTWHRLCAGALAVLVLSCSDDSRPIKKIAQRPTSSEEVTTDPCEDKEDGESCGMARHCIQERCLINICGDGIVAGTEQCDDGNQSDTDDCTPSCQRPRGTCGDGSVDPGEECDDANDRNDDFCTSTCLRQLCRNGVLDFNEECDDGNTDPSDGCSNSCQKIVCGDGKAEEQEECDDGNQREDDACSNHCTNISCGNMRIDSGEACDGRLKKSASGKPEGEPIADGLNCAMDCKSIVDDRCQKCEQKECPTYLLTAYGSDFDGVDVSAACRKVGVPIGPFALTTDQVTDASFVAKCSALMDCARRNRCDLYVPTDFASTHDTETITGHELLVGCFCGETALGSGVFDNPACFPKAAGKCVQQYYDATDCTDGICVEGNANASGLPATIANYLSECHRNRCFKDCR
jgi:cysteine-rich repeat protein